MHYTVRVLEGNICKRKSTRDIDTLCKQSSAIFFKTVRVTPKKLILIYLYTKL